MVSNITVAKGMIIIKRKGPWLKRIISMAMLYVFCWYQFFGFYSSQFATVVIVSLLHGFVLYAFLKDAGVPRKDIILRQGLIYLFVMLCRVVGFLQGFEYGTPVQQVLTVALRKMPPIVLLHLAVQIVFSVVFYHMERRKQAQVSQ